MVGEVLGEEGSCDKERVEGSSQGDRLMFASRLRKADLGVFHRQA